MGTTNRQVLKPRNGVAVRSLTVPENLTKQFVDLPLDFSANVGGNGQNVPYYHIDVNQIADTFGYIKGIKVDTRNMNTDLVIAVRGGALGEITNSLPGEGIEMITIEPGIISTMPVEATQDMTIDAFVTNSDPVASAATYGSAVIYLTNFSLPNNQWPSKNVQGIVPPAKLALNINATGTQPIVVWANPLATPRILQGARLVKPFNVTAAVAGGIKVVINAVVTTPTTGAQNFPLMTLYNDIPAAASSSKVDSYDFGGNLGIYLPKYTTSLTAIATLDQAVTAGAYELEILLQDSSNDTAPLT